MTKTVSRLWTGVLMGLALAACSGAGDTPSVERPATTVRVVSPTSPATPAAAASPVAVTTIVGQRAGSSAADKVVAEADALIAEADALLDDDLDA